MDENLNQNQPVPEQAQSEQPNFFSTPRGRYTAAGVLILAALGVAAWIWSGSIAVNPPENLSEPAWQTYRNEEYGYEVGYPGDWVVDVNLFDWAAGSGAVFCPPELQDAKPNGLTGDGNSCVVGKTIGGSINPVAPVVLRVCDPKSSVGSVNCTIVEGFYLGEDRFDKYSYKLTLYDPSYQYTYNQILSTFRFIE